LSGSEGIESEIEANLVIEGDVIDLEDSDTGEQLAAAAVATVEES
jgi:hypothetical protein